MMSDMNGPGATGQTIVAAESQSIRLAFYWGKSCFKGKYPRWRQVAVTQLLHDNGLTDEMLSHELKLINDQVNAYYGSCMKCFVLLYILVLLIGFGAIGAQFVFTEYRKNVMDIINNGAL